MFTLNKDQFKEFDSRKAKKFVDCWSIYYSPDTTTIFNSDKVINYIEELNIEKKLTDQNIKRLLRWKDPLRLTEKIQSPKKYRTNEKVRLVINKLKNINDFRFGKISEENFKSEAFDIFPNGLVWPVFLFHIARPFEYPMADQNVFRAFSVHKQRDIPKDWKGYTDYIEYFFEISILAGIITIKPKGNEHDIKDIVSKLKKVDDALYSFGKFLRFYR